MYSSNYSKLGTRWTGEWSTERPDSFTPEKGQFEYKGGWSSETVRRFWRDKTLVPPGIRTPNRPHHALITIPITLFRFPLLV
jgi:hypothetical protein